MTLHLFATIFFLCLNMFFVLAEFALVKAQPSRLEVMADNGRMRANIVLNMMKHMDNYLSAIQIGVTIGTLGLGWAAEPELVKFFNGIFQWPAFAAPYSHSLNAGISFIVVVYFQIVFGELVPRSLAIQKAEQIAVWLALPLRAYYETFRLPIHLMARSSMLVLRLIGVRPVGEHTEVFTEDEVRVLLGMSQEKGLLPLDRLLLIENLFDFADLKAKDAMKPRDKVVFLSTAKSWEENAAILRDHHFSRYPLGQPDLDQVKSFVHVKDLSLRDNVAPNLAQLARPLTKVEDSEPLPALLKTMASQGKHMLAVTRGGKTAGILTLEDVIEEIIGEILDEFDAPNAWSFHNLLSKESIDLHLKATSPSQAILTLVNRMKSVRPDLDLKLAEKAVLQREAQLPTAIGRGVAVPHARLASLEKTVVAIGRTDGSVAFAAPDKKPVRLVFLILTPASQPLEQLRVLARIAMLAHNETVLRQLMRATLADKFLDIIRTSEAIVVG